MARTLLWTIVVAWMAAGAALGQDRPPPPVTSGAWEGWYQALLASRLADCPRNRAITYHFSQDGSDATGDGSALAPWRTLERARAVLEQHPEGGVALLFRRGDVWRATTGLDATAPGVTIADYGVGEKPIFTAFELIPDTAWIPTPGRVNVYQRPEVEPVTWANEDDNLDLPYRASLGVADVEANEGSWWWEGGVLYVHPRHGPEGFATDPRVDGKAYQVVRTTGPGVRVFGDGGRVENIRAIGYGMRSGLTIQDHGIGSHVEGLARAVFVGCESYYGLAHCMTHWAGRGGVATFVSCRAGLTAQGLDGSVFNTYAWDGGARTIWHECEALYGALPHFARPPDQRGAIGFYGHTGTASRLGLTVSHGCTTRDTPHGCSAPSNFSDLPFAGSIEDVRCFIVGETFEGGPGTGVNFAVSIAHAARVNGRYMNVYPAPVASGGLIDWPTGGWAVNCAFQVDCTRQSEPFGLYGHPWAASTAQYWHCAFELTTRPDQQVYLDWRSAHPRWSGMFNSILACVGGGTCVPNLDPGLMVANAYYGVAGVEDPSGVVLTSPPGLWAKPACGSVLACRGAALPGGTPLAFDCTGEESAARNSVGPVQSAACGNCDGSLADPRLNVADFGCFLTWFALGSPRANCDGSAVPPTLNIADFSCFLQRFSERCE